MDGEKPERRQRVALDRRGKRQRVEQRPPMPCHAAPTTSKPSTARRAIRRRPSIGNPRATTGVSFVVTATSRRGERTNSRRARIGTMRRARQGWDAAPPPQPHDAEEVGDADPSRSNTPYFDAPRGAADG